MSDPLGAPLNLAWLELNKLKAWLPGPAFISPVVCGAVWASCRQAGDCGFNSHKENAGSEGLQRVRVWHSYGIVAYVCTILTLS